MAAAAVSSVPSSGVIRGTNFLGATSAYVRTGCEGVVGLLAYDVCEPLTKDEYDQWLFEVHYHDLMSNPHLEKITLHTVTPERKARLSSGAEVTNAVTFYRLAEMCFKNHEAYDEYIKHFQANAIPPPRTPAGKSAFKFYHMSESESIVRLETSQDAASAPIVAPTAPQTVLVVGSSGNLGQALVPMLRAMEHVTVLEASRSGAVRLDLYDEASVRSLGERLPGGAVHHVVVCCGASHFGPLASFGAAKWAESCGNKFMAVSRLIVMLANGEEAPWLKEGGSITVTTGQAARTVNKMWPGIAANNAGLEAMVKCAGVDPPRGLRINAVAPALVTETAQKAGMPLEGTVAAADVAKKYLPLIFGTATGQVVDAGVQVAFKKSHHAGQRDGVKP